MWKGAKYRVLDLAQTSDHTPQTPFDCHVRRSNRTFKEFLDSPEDDAVCVLRALLPLVDSR